MLTDEHKKIIDNLLKKVPNEELAEYIYSKYKEEFRIRNSCFQDIQKSPKKIKKQEGFVYFLKEHSGKIKIGKTKNLNKRIFHLGIKFPIEPVLIHSFKTTDITRSEKELHEKYKKI